MRIILLSTTIAALIAAAACSREEQVSGGNVPDSQTGNAVAQPSGPITAEQAYQIRHERYEEMGDSLKAINRELKSDAPDVARVQREAATLASLAEQIPTWFPVGSGPDVHARSRAKAEIWSDPDGFRQAHAAYLEQAQRFKQVADSGDVNAMRAAGQTLGKACGNCHERYRGPER